MDRERQAGARVTRHQTVVPSRWARRTAVPWIRNMGGFGGKKAVVHIITLDTSVLCMLVLYHRVYSRNVNEFMLLVSLLREVGFVNQPSPVNIWAGRTGISVGENETS